MQNVPSQNRPHLRSEVKNRVKTWVWVEGRNRSEDTEGENAGVIA